MEGKKNKQKANDDTVSSSSGLGPLTFIDDLVEILDKHKIGQATGTNNVVIAHFIKGSIMIFEQTIQNAKIWV